MEGYLPEKTCRTCLQKSDDLTSLHSKKDDAGPTLLEKLRFCASMQILVSERTPSNACAVCVRCITEYYDFKRRCELSEKTLEDLCSEPSECPVAKVEVVLKEEGGDDRTVVTKKEPDDSNSSCDDDPNWTPYADDKEEVDEKECGSGDEDNRSESKLKFACEMCGKRFKWFSFLKRHRRVHEKQHMCAVCGERFKSAEERSTHVQTCRTKKGTAETKFSCEQCGKEFKYQSAFNRHRQVHLNDRQFGCDICKKSFKSKYDMQSHVRRHIGQKRRCDGCDKLYDTLSAMLRHRASEHPRLDPYDDKARNQLSCEVCKETFLIQADITRHLLSHAGQHWFKCGKCVELFQTKSEMLTHARDCREEEVPSEDDESQLQVIPTANVVEERADSEQEDSKDKKPTSGDPDFPEENYPCDVCSRSFNKLRALKQHKKRNHSTQLHYCDQCEKPFATEYKLTQHKLTHKPKHERRSATSGKPDVPKDDFSCDVCSRSFDKIRALRQHKKRNHSTELHYCDQCGKPFGTEYKLAQHKQKHKPKQRQGTKFVCETCGKVYSFRESLHQHISENHAAERKVHECKVCGKKYNFVCSYYAHMRLHKERSQYECGVCKKVFDLKVRFNTHMRLHNKQHQCDICDMRFQHRKDLAKHKLCHARDAAKPYDCKLCSKRFSTAAAVSFHMSTLHNSKKHIKCDVCGMEFYNRFHYAAHYSKHTGVKPYQCDICGKGYSYKQDFLPHRKQCVAQREDGQNKEAEVTSTSAS